MKPSVLALALVPLLAAPALEAQTPAAAAPTKPPATDPSMIQPPSLEADPTLETLKKLKPEDAEKVKKNINEASTFVSGIRLQEALQRLVEAELLAPDLFMIHNLKGAVFTKMRLFDKARASFERATKLWPASFHPKFNLAEIEFVEAAAKTRKKEPDSAPQWAKAQAAFEQLLKGRADDGTKKLVQFKLTICLLQQEKTAEATAMINSFSYIDDEPIYYLSHAAEAFQKGDKLDAQSWIDAANRIYYPQVISVYLDSFIELGWVESLSL